MGKINFYFLFFYLIKQYLNYLVFPLEVSEKFDKIENLLSFNSTYSTLEMGTPPQKVDFYFYMTHSKMYITNIGCKNTHLYNLSIESSTLNVIGDLQYDSRVLFMETLSFYDNINLSKRIEFDEYPLLLVSNFSSDLFDLSEMTLCGDVGLSIAQYQKSDIEMDEFEYYMKYLKTLNNQFSFFHYNGKDFLINNISLHIEFKDMFKDVQNISWINPIIRDDDLRWEIYIKEIYYNNVHFKNKITVELNPLFELIIGFNDYKTNIQNDFFNSYINQKICSIIEVNGYNIFECDANKFGINNIKQFPSLKFFISEINHIFKMTGEELFYKLENKYYFNIIFPIKNLESNRWILGKIFMRKYSTAFSPLNRLIGFYIVPNGGEINDEIEKESKNDKNGNENKTFIYVLIVVIALIFTGLGLFIGKIIFFPKKRKANELIDDNYEYKPEPIAGKINN